MVKHIQFCVWFVDDEADERFFIEHALKRLGEAVRFRAFQNGPELQQALQTVQVDERPHLIICDLRMPGMDGIDVVQWLRASRWSFLRCLILSNSAVPEDKCHARRAGADDYFVKPRNPNDLNVRVKEILDEWQKRTTWMYLPLINAPAPSRVVGESSTISVGAHCSTGC